MSANNYNGLKENVYVNAAAVDRCGVKNAHTPSRPGDLIRRHLAGARRYRRRRRDITRQSRTANRAANAATSALYASGLSPFPAADT